MEQINIPKQNYKVLVRCFTYNQSKYIEDALNGFAMQQTDFPFVCLVMDDCSTDGEQEVIKAWMERECDMVKAEYIDIELSNVIIVPHKSNTSCAFAFYFLKQNLYGSGKKKMNMIYPWRDCCEYEALCEGDDYWIVPDKLEKQVKLLDANPAISFCHTGFDCLINNYNIMQSGDNIVAQNLKIQESGENLLEAILDGTRYRIQTVTAMIRISRLREANILLSSVKGIFLMGDTQLWLSLLSLGTVGFIPKKTSVYRKNNGSACRQNDLKKRLRFDLSCAEMYVTMANLFSLSDELKCKLQKQYQKKLNVYFCFDKEYKPFVKIVFCSMKDKLQYYVLKSWPIRYLFKMIYKRHYIQLVKKNDGVSLS